MPKYDRNFTDELRDRLIVTKGLLGEKLVPKKRKK